MVMITYVTIDLGHGEIDDTKQVLRDEEPSLNTTRRLVEEMEYQDLVLHIGDICYAEGFAATVRLGVTCMYKECRYT